MECRIITIVCYDNKFAAQTQVCMHHCISSLLTNEIKSSFKPDKSISGIFTPLTSLPHLSMQNRTFRKASSFVSLLLTVEMLLSLIPELLKFGDSHFLCNFWASSRSCVSYLRVRVIGTLGSHLFQVLLLFLPASTKQMDAPHRTCQCQVYRKSFPTHCCSQK